MPKQKNQKTKKKHKAVCVSWRFGKILFFAEDKQKKSKRKKLEKKAKEEENTIGRMSDAFGFGPVPLAGESPKDKKTCAFCERSTTVSPKFLKIGPDRRVGDVPLLLTKVTHPESPYVCLQHWEENKHLYEVCAFPAVGVLELYTLLTVALSTQTHQNTQKQFGRDSFEGNPTSVDAILLASNSVCHSHNSCFNSNHTKSTVP